MSRGLILGLVLLLLASACGRSQGDDRQNAGPSHGQDSGTIQSRITIEGGSGPDADGFSLGFGAVPASASVVVAEATGSRVVAYLSPGELDTVTGRFDNPTEAGGPRVFQLVDPAPAIDAEWFEVLLPVRPNGTTGWIRADEVTLSRNPFRIEIGTADHRLAVYKENEPWLTTTVAIGTGATPTPIGRFFITELLRPPVAGGPYGPFAFGLSGFSETLLNYAGGDGVIGIHGTNDPGSLGTDVSHGCVRMANEDIERLAGVLPLGTPVIIRT